MNHTYTLTLIASDTPLSISHLEIVVRFIEEQAIGLVSKPSWIEQHIAAQLPIQNSISLEQIASLRALLKNDQIDVLCTPYPSADIKLILADMDATIVEGETLDELAARAGIKEQIASITTRAMNGEIDFKEALRERVALLKGLPVKALAQTLAETKLTQGADTFIMGQRARGLTCVLVSGGFTYFTNAIGEKCGFNANHGNILNNDGYELDGTVGEPILDKDAKLAYLKHYTQEMGIDLKQTCAIGDGANDIPMLAAAGLGIGYRPKPLVEQTILNVLKYANLDRLKYVL
jgi:phosphoserine phosphatase